MSDRKQTAVLNPADVLDPVDVLEPLKDMVRRAGRMMLEAPLARIESHEKSGWGDFVTQYDVKIQAWLMDAVAKRFPGAAFKGEEAGLDRTALDGDVFIADPIDGTLNFIRGREQSAVSVAFWAFRFFVRVHARVRALCRTVPLILLSFILPPPPHRFQENAVRRRAFMEVG